MIESETISVSQQGVSFTTDAVSVMNVFSKELLADNQLLCWTVAFDKHEKPIIGMCGYYEVPQFAIPDSVGDIAFHWCADPPGLEAVRNYCVDAKHDAPSRLIPLSKRYKPGDGVTLSVIPEELVRNLPSSDQEAIKDVVGKALTVIGYDNDGQIELEFTDASGVIHTIWVNPEIVSKII